MVRPYFVVSRNKLILLSIISIGLYDLYWFYKNWEVIRINTKRDISPLFRAIFDFIFAYWCFKQFNKTAQENGIVPPLKSGLLALVLLLFTFSGFLPEPFWIFGYARIIIVILANNFILNLNNKVFPNSYISSELTTGNWVLIVVGVILWFLNIALNIVPDFLCENC